jgi:threonine aldolase
MRQAGILAAAGIVAVTKHVDRLVQDHANAAVLARGLSGIQELAVDAAGVQTNMVFVSPRNGSAAALKDYLKSEGILINSGNPIRLVTHLDVDTGDMHAAVDAFKRYFSKHHQGE